MIGQDDRFGNFSNFSNKSGGMPEIRPACDFNTKTECYKVSCSINLQRRIGGETNHNRNPDIIYSYYLAVPFV
jgi:hypothetical protein